MADTKISALTALTGANLASGDQFVTVDVSDTTMAASGTDKKMTATELATGLGNLFTWTGYTPTLTQSGAVTKTVVYARYVQIGKLVIVYMRLDVTGSGTTNNAIIAGLPVTALQTNAPVGIGEVIDASGATVTYPATVLLVSATTVIFRRNDQSPFVSSIGVDPNFALASGDVVQFVATYEAA